MNCSVPDADLLMLAHGELSRSQTFRLRLHLALCPGCRTRLRKYEALAGMLAKSFRNPVLGVRSLGKGRAPVWASVGFLAALLTLLGWLVASTAVATNGPPVPPVIDVPKRACPLHAATTPVSPVHACPLHAAKKPSKKSNFSCPICDR